VLNKFLAESSFEQNSFTYSGLMSFLKSCLIVGAPPFCAFIVSTISCAAQARV
jgi:hypothetical protein